MRSARGRILGAAFILFHSAFSRFSNSAAQINRVNQRKSPPRKSQFIRKLKYPLVGVVGDSV
jgi:hypothetical protein